MNKQKLSFDYKLMVGYHIFMMILFPIGFFIPNIKVYSIAGLLLVALSIVSIIYKISKGWHWIKPDIKGIGKALFSVVTGAILFFVVTNSFGRNGLVAPWVSALVGITYYNLLSGLNLADRNKEAFLKRIENEQPKKQRVSNKPEKYKKLRIAFRIYFIVSWFAFMYWMYSSSQYTKTWSKNKTELKSVEIESHGITYYVNKEDKDMMAIKSFIIIPLFVSSILFLLLLKYKFGIDLLKNDEGNKHY